MELRASGKPATKGVQRAPGCLQQPVLRIQDILVRILILLFSSTAEKLPTKNTFDFHSVYYYYYYYYYYLKVHLYQLS